MLPLIAGYDHNPIVISLESLDTVEVRESRVGSCRIPRLDMRQKSDHEESRVSRDGREGVSGLDSTC